MAEIRTATLDDVPALVAIGRMLHAESPRYAGMNYDGDKVARLAEMSIPGGGVFVAVRGGTIVGVIAGFVVPHWFGDTLLASDYTFYIVPECRAQGRTAMRLLHALEKWAAEQGARDIVPGTSTMINAEGTLRFYEHQGYERIGYAVSKRIG